MKDEKRSVLKILEDAKRVSYAIAVMLVTIVIQISRGPVHDRVHMHTIPMYMYVTPWGKVTQRWPAEAAAIAGPNLDLRSHLSP